VFRLSILILGAFLVASCADNKPSNDEQFTSLAKEILEDTFRREPTWSTSLGVHKYDDKLEDYSKKGVSDTLKVLRAFRDRVEQIPADTLSLDNQLDREQLLHFFDSRILSLDTVRGWQKNPDFYTSGISYTAYLMIKRSFAPLEERLKLLIAREKHMVLVLAEARKNIDNPPRIYVEIALEQVDSNRDLFKDAVTEAFKDVKDKALLAELKESNNAVLAAFDEYKAWLQKDLLPRAKGEYALGADTYRKKLWADEMIDTPLDELLKIAEADLQANKAAFAKAAALIDPKKSAAEVLAIVERDHPAANKLIPSAQDTLDSLAQFLVDHKIATVPKAERARVQETPSFMRATTFASMDIPGPYEMKATEAYYSVTLPDPKWPAEKAEDYMKGWYYPLISNVSVHEVWPGHYLQFLYAKDFPSDVRKVFSANSNVEGWAHYAEQMMIDEGLHADDPRYRIAELHDALLRNVRFIVGIKLHTQGMTIQQARDLFVKEGFQSEGAAEAEAKRGSLDPTYGYYTMGKLMILKLREDYKKKMGSQYSLQSFHDAFIKLGPLPLPLIRKAMLGEIGKSF
jgi:uncharacterized protein (DUF885 family)